jgi:predicted ATPase
MGNSSSSWARSRIVPGGPLVGRERELARILAALETRASGGGQFVLVSGEPGVGKSRLAQEVLVGARERGDQVLVGRCFDQHRSVPFFPFVEAFEAALLQAPAPLQNEARRRWPELAHLLPDSGSTPLNLEGQDAQLRIFRAATSFLCMLAEVNPLVLLIDDLHWADSTSLSLLLYLGRHLDDARILVLGTYRDTHVQHNESLSETLRELARERRVDELHLGALTLQDTATLIKGRLTVDIVPDEFVAFVHTRAMGNAFFTGELLKALIERGIQHPVNGPWPRIVVDQLRVPPGIRSVVGERVRRLGQNAQELLQVASVLGQQFELELLLAASDQPGIRRARPTGCRP